MSNKKKIRDFLYDLVEMDNPWITTRASNLGGRNVVTRDFYEILKLYYYHGDVFQSTVAHALTAMNQSDNSFDLVDMAIYLCMMLDDDHEYELLTELPFTKPKMLQEDTDMYRLINYHDGEKWLDRDMQDCDTGGKISALYRCGHRTWLILDKSLEIPAQKIYNYLLTIKYYEDRH